VKVGIPPEGLELNLGHGCLSFVSRGTATCYLAVTESKFKELGGELHRIDDPRTRSIRCDVDRIDPETGVADISLLRHDGSKMVFMGVIADAPHRQPSGQFPFPDEPGNIWYAITG